MTEKESSPYASRRKFLKIGAGVVAGAAVAAATVSQVPLVGASASPAQTSQTTSVSTSQSQISTSTTPGSTTSSVSSSTGSASTSSSTNQASSDVLTNLIGYTSLSSKEAAMVEAIAATIIPSDSTGPGAKEAGVSYFIDRQLASGYGTNDRMYNRGPYLAPNQSGSFIVDGITYTGGTPSFAYTGGFGYQYGGTLRDFWKLGLASMQAYSNTAYGGDFETLSSANMMKLLQDLAGSKPTNFTNGPSAKDFFSEVFAMVWAGFLSDPIYGGNRGMVGWSYIGFNGLNSGDFFGEGHTSMDLMVASTPTRLGPVSIAMIQQLTTGSTTTTTASTSSASSSSSSASSSGGGSTTSSVTSTTIQ